MIRAMWKALVALSASKRALTTVAGIVVFALSRFKLDVPIEDLLPMMAAVIAFVLSQGRSDHGKEGAKIEAESDAKVGGLELIAGEPE